ncbi:MAG: TetR/AcrR family transcriptional regulator C-terminal domain-containing protein [Oscillospiraceae bacterium]|nr:TetR/AcrR family transcriptional regulator C-terminal domain-containing protein [Oscillospiraceae bacterium]
MANVRNDRRVSYTKMVLKNALIELMQEKHIGKITIKEICERADINRGTFYTHYTDQFDLQNQIFEDLLSRISAYMDQTPYASGTPESMTMLTCIFRFTYENRQLVKLVFSDHSTIHLQDEILRFLSEKKIFRNFPVRKEMEGYLYRYIAYGCVGIVREWLETGTDSPETIAELVMQLTEKGFSAFA